MWQRLRGRRIPIYQSIDEIEGNSHGNLWREEIYLTNRVLIDQFTCTYAQWYVRELT